jgi:hypothetical protein
LLIDKDFKQAVNGSLVIVGSYLGFNAGDLVFIKKNTDTLTEISLNNKYARCFNEKDMLAAISN